MSKPEGPIDTSPIIPRQPFSLTGRMRSFTHAFRGIGLMLVSQHNAWVHAALSVVVGVAGLVLGISRIEWCCILLAMVGVWVAEALNTGLEFLCDVASPQFHPMVRQAKDVSAGAVLLSAIGAAVVGILILGPPLLAKLGL